MAGSARKKKQAATVTMFSREMQNAALSDYLAEG